MDMYGRINGRKTGRILRKHALYALRGILLCFWNEVYHIDKLSLHQVKPNYFERYKVWRMTVRHNTSLQAINKSLNPLIHAVKKLQYQHEIDYDIAEAIRDSYFSNRQVISQKEERRSINEKYLSKNRWMV